MMLEATGSVISNDEMNWRVECLGCGQFTEFEGFYEENDVVACEHCGCKFRTIRVYFESGDYMGRPNNPPLARS